MKSQIKRKDIASLLKQHNFIYKTPPVQWEQGLPLGNGSIGAVIWGDGNPLKLSIDSYELWDLREPTLDDPNYSYARFKELYQQGKAKDIIDLRQVHLANIVPSRLPAIRVEISFGSSVKKFKAELDLGTATARGLITLQHGNVQWQAYTVDDSDLFIINFKSRPYCKPDVQVRFDHLSKKASAEMKRRGFSKPETGKLSNLSWAYQEIPENGGYILAWKSILEKHNNETIIFTLLKGINKEALIKNADKQIETALSSLSVVYRKNKEWWSKFWDKSLLSVPDKSLEKLFYAEIYKLGCCSRPGKFPVTIQGVWGKDTEMPPWQGDYHLDLNPQESMWLVYTSNHLDCAEPLYAWLERLVPRFRKECKKFFECEGIFAPCAVGLNGERVYGYTTADTWPGAVAWLAFHFWEHYLYSQDENFLKSRAYPFMKEAMKLYANILEKFDDGLYHIPLSTSPEFYEYGHKAWGMDTTCDLSLIRFLGKALLQCVKKLNINEPDAKKWSEILNNLAPYPTKNTMKPEVISRWNDEFRLNWLPTEAEEYTPQALCLMKDVPYSFCHRHMSHLMSIYPIGNLTVEDSEHTREIIYDSIKQLWLFGSGKWWGWTLPWVSLIASRAKLPEMAYRLLKEYFNYFISSNTFHMNGDFRKAGVSTCSQYVMTLEAGFGAAAAIMEMLLQSWGGKIRIFPAIPDEWRDAIFYNLRAEGAFLVSAKLQDGKLQWVEIISEKGITCRLVNQFPVEQVIMEDMDKHKKIKIKGKILEFPTNPNSTYRFYSKPFEGK